MLREAWPEIKVCSFDYCLESSQDIAKRLHRDPGPTLVLCGEIREARGRAGRRWFAGRGGLWFTLAFKHDSPNQLGVIALGAGVAVARAISSSTGLEARVKWPNDVLVNERKVAGILIEASPTDGGNYLLLLGVGVNVNNSLPIDLAGQAATLKDYLGAPVNEYSLLARVVGELHSMYSELKSGSAFEILRVWKSLSATLSRPVKVTLSDGVDVQGVAVDVDENGGLVVDTGGKRLVFYFGEVIHLRHRL